VDGLKEKEPQGPGCRDYFWLVCRFVDSISKDDAISDSVSHSIVYKHLFSGRNNGSLNLCVLIHVNGKSK